MQRKPNQPKSKYTNKSIPPEIEIQLQTRFQCTSLSDLKLKKFRDAADSINSTVMEKYQHNRVLWKNYFKPDELGIFIDDKSLRRYFNHHPIRADKLAVLKCFLGYLPESMEEVASATQKIKPNKNIEYLLGAWYSYVYDVSEKSHNKVKRTVLFLSMRSSSYFNVQYEGLRGRYNGTAEIVKNTMIFTIHNKDNSVRMFLCAELPEGSMNDEKQEVILNVSCLSNSLSGCPVSSNVIMVRNNKADIDFGKPDTIEKYLSTMPLTLCYNITDTNIKLAATEATADGNEREIILYLSRHKYRNERLKVFAANGFAYVAERNIQAAILEGRDNYERLQIKLKSHVCFAFNRFRQSLTEVSIFSYTFEFYDEEKKCIAHRHPIGNPNKREFSGEVFLEGEKIFMILRDRNMQRRKHLIAPFNSPTDEASKMLVLNGITSSVSTLNGKAMALRELIVCIPESNKEILQSMNSIISEEDKTNGYMSYEKFTAIPEVILKSSEKLFLANSGASTLTIPSRTDTSFLHYRQDKARKYSGLYHLFAYEAMGNAEPLHMVLNIDKLSQVVLKIKYSNEPDRDTYIYHGVCEYYNNSLHIGAHLSSNYPNDERHSEFIFDPLVEKNRKLPEVLTGINLTTDDENKALAFYFFAIKEDWFIVNNSIHQKEKFYSSLLVQLKKGAGLLSSAELKLLANLLRLDNYTIKRLDDYLSE